MVSTLLYLMFSSFLLSTPSSQRLYVLGTCSDTPPLSVYLVQVNETLEIQLVISPLPKKKCLWYGVNFVISALPYITVLREMFKVQIRNYYRCHVVNEYKPSMLYLFLCKPTFKIQMQKYICWNGDTISK